MNPGALTHALVRPAAAIVGGSLLAFAFPSVGVGWFAPIGVALLTLVGVTSRSYRSAFGWGFLAGFACYLILVQWISVLGTDAWIALALYSALWIALTVLASRVVRHLPGWPVWVAALWVLQEALRDRIPWGGFPWGRLAFSQADAPTIGLAAIGGTAFLTFIIAMLGTLLALLALRWSQMPVLHRVGTAILIPVIWLSGLLVPLPTGGESAGGPANETVALIQGSVPQTGLDALSQKRAVLNNHVAVTLKLADDVAAGKAKAPAAVIWPENSSDVDPLTDPSARAAITQAADAIGVPILVGAVTTNPTQPGTVWNVGIVWKPDTGPSEYYVKRHPVPFGEYLPGRSILQKFISRFDRIPFDFAPGSEPGVLNLGPVKAGDVICFEIAYDDVVRDVVAAGARTITVQTNNATYLFDGPGGEAQPDQQAAMSQVRAVENGRGVLIAATSGVTAIISPDGEVVERLPFNEPQYIVADVPLRDSFTIAKYTAPWIELFLVVLATIALVTPILRVGRGHGDSKEHFGIVEDSSRDASGLGE